MEARALERIIFMKVGYHGGERLGDIVDRKKREESIAGSIFWGYGGTLCHPLKQVRPFAMAACRNGTQPRLVMSVTESHFESVVNRVEEFSADGLNWRVLPEGVLVKGSKYAIVCSNLQRANTTIDLQHYVVGAGAKTGWRLSEYLRGRVDKACAIRSENADCASTGQWVKIAFVADLVDPYAVVVR